MYAELKKTEVLVPAEAGAYGHRRSGHGIFRCTGIAALVYEDSNNQATADLEFYGLRGKPLSCAGLYSVPEAVLAEFCRQFLQRRKEVVWTKKRY